MKNLLLLPGLAILLATCQSSATEQGAKLAAQHCQRCHLLPDPQQLSRAAWRQVMPRMAPYLGWWYDQEQQRYLPMPTEVYEKIRHWGTVAAQPIIPAEELDQLNQYFLQLAPERLDSAAYQPITAALPGFQAQPLPPAAAPPVTILVQGQASRAGFWQFDGGGQWLKWHGPDLRATDSLPAPRFTIHLLPEAQPGSWLLTSMGTFNPSDLSVGGIYRLTKPANSPAKLVQLVDSLYRPVHTEQADLDQDGQPDLVVCEFGANVGRLAWYGRQADGRYVRHVLDPQPGACRSQTLDWDGDGDLDIVAIFGQGREGVFYYQNQGGGQFVARPWLQFPAAHGSNHFELADFNADGRLDLLCTNGDNADFPHFPIWLKPYHGVRIFINQGQDQFREHYFFRLNGAGKALARDFDQDGDLDIAAIAYFPDPARQPGEGFVYLQNQGGMLFRPFTFPGQADGWWLVMDAADYDLDGDPDLLLGSALTNMPVVSPGQRQQWIEQKLPGLVLWNQARPAIQQ